MEERDSLPIEAPKPIDGHDSAPAAADDDGPPGTESAPAISHDTAPSPDAPPVTEPTPANAGGSSTCGPGHDESGSQHATDAGNNPSEEKESGQKRAGEDIEPNDRASKVAREDDEPGIPGALPPRVRDALRQLYDSGRVSVNDLDKQALDSLRGFDEQTGVEIIEKYCEADLTSIRNKTGFFVGIIKRYRLQAPTASSHDSTQAFTSGLLAEPHAELFASTKAKLDQICAGSITQDEIAEGVQQLKAFTEETANTILEKFAEANLDQIRNKQGFLMGIIRRYQEQGAGASTSSSVAAFQALPYGIQMRLTPYYASGVIGQNDIEAKVYQSLAMFDPQTCNEIVNKFLESDLTKVANKSGWLVGIIKRFKNDGYACSAANAQAHIYLNQQYMAQMQYYHQAYAAAGYPTAWPGTQPYQ